MEGGRFLWAKKDPPEGYRWDSVMASDVEVDMHAPLNTPNWATCVIWLRNT